MTTPIPPITPRSLWTAQKWAVYGVHLVDAHDIVLGRPGIASLQGQRIPPDESVTLKSGEFLLVVAHPIGQTTARTAKVLIAALETGTLHVVPWSTMRSRVFASRYPEPILDRARKSDYYLVAAFVGMTFGQQPPNERAKEAHTDAVADRVREAGG